MSMKNFLFTEQPLTAIAMLAQHNTSSLPRGDNSLSKERPETEKCEESLT